MLTIKNRESDSTGRIGVHSRPFAVGFCMDTPEGHAPTRALRRCAAVIVLVLAGLLAGCTPAGPRALLQGQRLIARGDYARAADKLRTATSLLATNAQAWNYLGIACQHLGQRDEAVKAYQRALSLNHDLSEVHYNLGCVWLEENRLDAARSEFTTYTLRRGNSVEGFLKLATVQARARDLQAAETSYNDVLRLSPQDPEALNGLGLLRLQERRPAEAEQYFAAALKQKPGYRPALLNSAITAQEYLHDAPAALARYREYLALKPAPPNADAVAATVRALEQEVSPAPHPAPAARTAQPATTNPATTRPPGQMARALASPKSEPAPPLPRPAPTTNPPKPSATVTAPPPQPTQVVRLPPEPAIKPAQEPTIRSTAGQHTGTEPVIATAPVTAPSAEPKAPKRGFFDRVNPANVFRGDTRSGQRVTPLPAPKEASGPAAPFTSAGSSAASPSGPASRYNYRSPAAPAPGNRAEAQHFFDLGLQAQQAHRLHEAIQDYHEATQQDPSFFEAQFYLAFAAAQAGDLATALTHYEYALAISPNDPNARYNFALVLKQANCIPDAVTELERLLATHPNEARAHLALANIYAQQMREPAEARRHYLRTLELDPRNPEASDIRTWLRDHPQ